MQVQEAMDQKVSGSSTPQLARAALGIEVPVEPDPGRAAHSAAIDAPVAVSGYCGDDGQSAPVLVVNLVGRPRAPVVDYLAPRVIAGVERYPNGEGPVGMAGATVQDGVGR